MSAMETSLPAGFEALAPFVEFWAVDTAAERAHCRDISDEASRVAFYNAANDLVPKALAYLDAKPLNQFDESEQRLMKLVLSFGHVAMAVELQREEEPKHAQYRPYMRITRAPADQPCRTGEAREREQKNLPDKKEADPKKKDNPSATAWQGFRKFRVDRKVVENANGTVNSFYLVPEDREPLPHYLPGQFLTFSLDIPTATGGTEQVLRCYSLSDAPRHDYYRISIKRISPPPDSDVPPGRSSNYFHDQVEVGSFLQVRTPSGQFYIDRSDTPVVLICGGIGITPMLSMLNWLLVEQSEREVWLYYGVQNGRELVERGHLESLALKYPAFHLRFCFSNPLPAEVAGQDYQHRGRIDINLLQAQLKDKPYQFYICGPASMMKSLVPALEDWGVPDANIHFEEFGPASISLRSATGSVVTKPNETVNSNIVVTFSKSGKKLNWQSSSSLLEFAEANGISVDFGCRAGCCGTCQTKIQAGEVIYHQAPDFQPESESCLLCVSVPKTNLTLEL